MEAIITFMVAKTDAWDQIVGFWGLLIIAWWIMLYPHTDDGVPDSPRMKWWEKQNHAALIDPGVAIALEVFEHERTNV